MTRPIEFLVQGISTDSEGQTIFVGVPNNGLPIRVSDVFILKFEVPREEASKRPEDRLHVSQAEVALTVRRILFHRQFVDQLSAGTTGALYLDGTGADKVTGAGTCFLHTAGDY